MKDDIQSITYNGVTATINPDGSISWSSGANAGFEVKPIGGGYEIVLTMPKGAAMGEFTITPRNDAMTEKGETFKLELVSTDGSETSIHSSSTGAKEVAVIDDMNGYVANIEPINVAVPRRFKPPTEKVITAISRVTMARPVAMGA